MSDHLAAQRLDDVIREFSRAKQNGYPLDFDAYRLLLLACSRVGDMATASRVIKDMERNGPQPDPEAYVLLLRAAANGSDRIEAVVKLVGELHHKLGQNTEAHLTVAEVLLRGGQPKFAGLAAQLLEELGDAPNERLLGLTLLANGILQKYEELLKVIERIKHLGLDSSLIVQTHAVLAFFECRRDRNRPDHIAFAFTKALKAAEATGRSLSDTELVLLSRAVATMMKFAEETGDVKGSLAARQMVRAGFGKQISGCAEDVDILETADLGVLRIIEGALKKERSTVMRRELHEQWLAIFADMKFRRGFSYGQEVSNTILRLHMAANREDPHRFTMNSTMKLFDDMKREGSVPDRETYTILMQGWSLTKVAVADGADRWSFQEERVQRTLEVFDDMQKAGLEATTSCYAHLFAACANPYDLDAPGTRCDARVFEFEQRMLEQGLLHDAVSATAIVAALAAGYPQEAVQRFNDMRISGIPRSLETYNTMIHRLGTRPKSAEFVLNDLRASMRREIPPVVPDASTWEGWLTCCIHAGDIPTAFRLFVDMKREGVKPAAKICEGLLGLCDRNGEMFSGLRKRILSELEERGIEVWRDQDGRVRVGAPQEREEPVRYSIGAVPQDFFRHEGTHT
ncbi:hypothetical protein HK104_005039 [Borealophlyctis nickersoniae]|nr:hypothetical protein HK104_005039 [Borealophlyctis nickersoniae]